MEGIKITKETIKSNKTTELKKEDRASETNTLKMANVLNDFFVNIVKQMGDDSISSRPFNERKLHEFVSSKIENLVTQYNQMLYQCENTKTGLSSFLSPFNQAFKLTCS